MSSFRWLYVLNTLRLLLMFYTILLSALKFIGPCVYLLWFLFSVWNDKTIFCCYRRRLPTARGVNLVKHTEYIIASYRNYSRHELTTGREDKHSRRSVVYRAQLSSARYTRHFDLGAHLKCGFSEITCNRVFFKVLPFWIVVHCSFPYATNTAVIRKLRLVRTSIKITCDPQWNINM